MGGGGGGGEGEGGCCLAVQWGTRCWSTLSTTRTRSQNHFLHQLLTICSRKTACPTISSSNCLHAVLPNWKVWYVAVYSLIYLYGTVGLTTSKFLDPPLLYVHYLAILGTIFVMLRTRGYFKRHETDSDEDNSDLAS